MMMWKSCVGNLLVDGRYIVYLGMVFAEGNKCDGWELFEGIAFNFVRDVQVQWDFF